MSSDPVEPIPQAVVDTPDVNNHIDEAPAEEVPTESLPTTEEASANPEPATAAAEETPAKDPVQAAVNTSLSPDQSEQHTDTKVLIPETATVLDGEALAKDPIALAKAFPSEKDDSGWTGYVEWEGHPDRKLLARDVLSRNSFTAIPEFQYVPLPDTNPILIGHRWKEYHAALGPSLEAVPDQAWEIVEREKRMTEMLTVLDFPFNGEPFHESLFDAGPITPNDLHFIRNHGGIPTIDADKFVLEIGGLVNKPVKLSLADLKDPAQFDQHEVTVTLQCSGTRRIEQIQQYPGDGDELINAPWGEGAIGTAVYRGVSLKQVLKRACGDVSPSLRPDPLHPRNGHAEFLGIDTYFKKGTPFNYAVSVPLRKVEAAKGSEVLLAWEMNGEPLRAIHGAPLRVVVAGYIGARSCKWLYKINVLEEPSMGPVQQQEYLYYTPQLGKQNVLYSNGFSIQDMPVSSAILTPKPRQMIVHEGTIEIKGWAYSGGGRWIERVEVSPDGGHVWYQVPPENLSKKHYHAWRLWKIDLPILAEGWLEICVRGWDNALNTQPTFVRSAWNFDLHVTSSSHRIQIYSVDKRKPLTAARIAQFAAHGLDFAKERFTLPIPFGLEDTNDYLEAMHRIPREPVD